MWSDTLLAVERAHLLRLALWGGISLIAGTALFAWMTMQRSASPLLRGFSLQTGLWGAVSAGVAALGMLRLAERDLMGATRLDRLLWFSAGLDLGIMLVGSALAVTGWILGRRLGLVGGGIAVIVQGAGLLVLDLRFISITARVL
jgi:hypothetical protein